MTSAPDNAVASLVTALKEKTAGSPHDADAWYSYGLLLAHAGEHTEALAAINRTLELEPQNVEAAVTRCFLLGAMGNIPEAFREFTRLRRAGSGDERTAFPLGVFCMRYGWKDAGLGLLMRAERRQGGTPYVLATVACALFEMDNQNAAYERLERLRLAVRRLRIDFLCSRVKTRFEELDTFQKWENPCLTTAPILLADHRAAGGMVTEAETELFRANARYPGHPPSMVALGRLHAAQGKVAEAEQWFAGALVMDETCHEAHYELSFIRGQAEDNRHARKHLQAAVTLQPLYADYRFNLGVLLTDTGESERALEEFKRVRLLDPARGETALYMASIYLEQGASNKALAVLDESPCADWPEALVLQAQAQINSGKHVEAQHILERVLAADADNAEAREVLNSLAAGA